MHYVIQSGARYLRLNAYMPRLCGLMEATRFTSLHEAQDYCDIMGIPCRPLLLNNQELT